MIDNIDNKKLLKGFAKRFRNLRQNIGLNQTELSNRLGYTNSFISELENEKGKPSYEFLIKLQNTFRVNLGWLLQGNGDMFLNHGEFPNMENPPKLSSSEKDVEKFFWYFNYSPMFKHTIMGFALKFLHDNQVIIKQDIEIYKSELEEEKNKNEKKNRGSAY
jgi:transcriptional regulator with XRE-family HTH domain